MDPRGSPQRIGKAHVTDQLADLQRHLRSSAARPRSPAPILAVLMFVNSVQAHCPRRLNAQLHGSWQCCRRRRLRGWPLGYAQPVGGVIAYEKQISISGVGFDIACGNMAVRLQHGIDDNRDHEVSNDHAYSDWPTSSSWTPSGGGHAPTPNRSENRRLGDARKGLTHDGPLQKVCLAHLIRDAQYAIDAGDIAFAPGLQDLLQRACKIGRRRARLADATLQASAQGSTPNSMRCSTSSRPTRPAKS